MIKLNDKTILAIRKDRNLKNKLLVLMGIGDRSLQYYLTTNDKKLTTLDVLNIITEHLNLPLSQVLQGEKLSKLLSE